MNGAQPQGDLGGVAHRDGDGIGVGHGGGLVKYWIDSLLIDKSIDQLMIDDLH